MSGPEVQDPSQQSLTSQLSNLVVRVIHDYTGRGPTKASSSIHGDFVTVLLSDTLTKGEHSLVADGRAQLVLDVRKAFQSSMREELIQGVEEITGRRVVAFMSDNHIDPDVAVEAFVLDGQVSQASPS